MTTIRPKTPVVGIEETACHRCGVTVRYVPTACKAVEAGLGEQVEELVAAAAAAGLDERETRRTVASAQRRAGGAT